MMRNRYPGTCCKCGRYVPIGYGFFERVNFLKHGRKWLIKCVECVDGRTVHPNDPEVKRAQRLHDKAKERE